MHGKDYIFTVQAINRNQKMSLVSDEAIFRVANLDTQTTEQVGPVSKDTTNHMASPITNLEATDATPDDIVLQWPDVSDASDYKLKWDKGE